ncbi:MAG: DUF1080 domain-containing protein [Fuerstiella sp.]
MSLRFAILILLTFCSLKSASADSWVNLLKDQKLDHWMKQDGSKPAATWQFENGWLHLNGKGGNLITKQEYSDFELWFEFRISEKGNSGIKYRVQKYGERYLGLEYQVLDDPAFPKLTDEHKTGSLYDLVTPSAAAKRLNPQGQMNVAKIRVQGNRIQHWINGQLLIDERVDGPNWLEHVSNSKFKNHAGFGQNQLGRIMLTDHNCEVWYRNVYLKPLSAPVETTIRCQCP